LEFPNCSSNLLLDQWHIILGAPQLPNCSKPLCQPRFLDLEIIFENDCSVSYIAIAMPTHQKQFADNTLSDIVNLRTSPSANFSQLEVFPSIDPEQFGEGLVLRSGASCFTFWNLWSIRRPCLCLWSVSKTLIHHFTCCPD
jgi:hypothetical protein